MTAVYFLKWFIINHNFIWFITNVFFHFWTTGSLHVWSCLYYVKRSTSYDIGGHMSIYIAWWLKISLLHKIWICIYTVIWLQTPKFVTPKTLRNVVNKGAEKGFLVYHLNIGIYEKAIYAFKMPCVSQKHHFFRYDWPMEITLTAPLSLWGVYWTRWTQQNPFLSNFLCMLTLLYVNIFISNLGSSFLHYRQHKWYTLRKTIFSTSCNEGEVRSFHIFVKCGFRKKAQLQLVQKVTK